ncbi:hypothetical protein [Actinocorallia populi]|uniref:hypothetical protein n=1 Tax=Actinocorallia populi TaxID=2079200 RepID=UPI0013004B5B|nr:hypothetical protein [Actinocorallia populi]
MSVDEEEQESTAELYTRHSQLLMALTLTGVRIRSLAAQFTPWHSGQQLDAGAWEWVIEEFQQVASGVRRQDFESLILQTIQVYNTGSDILNPDTSPNPVPSPFVRRMPNDQAKVEANRQQRQVRHIVAYQEHIRQCLEHFAISWTALLDGGLICDWDMINDEFPKLERLQSEVQRAFSIWKSVE